MIYLSDFRNGITVTGVDKLISEINVNNRVIFDYNIYPHDENWNNKYLREARGITFISNTGKLSSLPFHKFFNINEVNETKEDVILNNCSNILVFDKIDGSLIVVELNDEGKLVCKTKRSYDNEQAQLANYILKNTSKKFRDFLMDVISIGYTPLFELVTDNPKLRIVVDYNETNLYFLALRNRITGEYVYNLTEIPILKNCNDVKFPNKIIFNNKSDFIKYKNEIEKSENIEGFVGICLNTGIFFKYKVKWYLERHRAKDIMKAPKEFVKLFIQGKLDDVFSLLSERDRKIAKKLESICFRHYSKLINDISKIVDVDKHLDRKEFALKYKHLPYFGLLIREYSGQKYDLEKYFIKYEYPQIRNKFEELLKGEYVV